MTLRWSRWGVWSKLVVSFASSRSANARICEYGGAGVVSFSAKRGVRSSKFWFTMASTLFNFN